MVHSKMSTAEVRTEAKSRAGLILESIMNGWEPDDLIHSVGQDNVDAIQEEILAISRRLQERAQ